MGVKNEISVVLTLEALSERWGVPLPALKRRLLGLALPAVNVGTAKAPDYRFRLSAIEAWEQANEATLCRPETEGVSVPTGAPPGLENYDPFKSRRKRARKV